MRAPEDLEPARLPPQRARQACGMTVQVTSKPVDDADLATLRQGLPGDQIAALHWTPVPRIGSSPEQASGETVLHHALADATARKLTSHQLTATDADLDVRAIWHWAKGHTGFTLVTALVVIFVWNLLASGAQIEASENCPGGVAATWPIDVFLQCN